LKFAEGLDGLMIGAPDAQDILALLMN
jgi:hypothetical protein